MYHTPLPCPDAAHHRYGRIANFSAFNIQIASDHHHRIADLPVDRR